MGRIELILGDITAERVDAIVNAANTSLRGGGGVDGAIRRAAGPALRDACRALGGCETGDAKATTAGDLHARYVIHAVGPVWRGGDAGESVLLGSAYGRSLDVAAALGCRSVAFPSISTGIYGFPVERAAPIAVGAVRDGLEAHPGIVLVRFVLFDQGTFDAFELATRRATT